MGKKSRNKTKVGERQGAKFLGRFGIEARRSQQYHGASEDAADLQTTMIGVRVENKTGYKKAYLGSAEVQGWIEKIQREIERTGEDRWLILWRQDFRKYRLIYEMNGIVCMSDHTQAEKVIKHLTDNYDRVAPSLDEALVLI